MKVKNLSFVVFFLAAASLGFALPSNSTLHKPKVHDTPKVNGTAKADSPVSPVNTNAAITQLESTLSAAKISPDCATAIVTVVADPDLIKCLPVGAVLSLLPVISDPTLLTKFIADPAGTYKNELEKPLITFATGLCAVPKCSDDVIGNAIKAIQDGCQKDLATNQLIQAMFAGFVFYSPSRDITCFQDGKQFCFDQTMLTVVSLPKSPFKITGNPLVDSIAVADPNAICTKCDKNIVNTIFNFLNDKAHNTLPLQILKNLGIDQTKIQEGQLAVAVKCGAGFVDGKISK